MATTDPAPGSAPAPGVVVEGSLTGTNLGGYVVGNQLAQGGMGLVYEATHPEIGRRAAVKVLKPEVAQDEEWSKRFLTEARAIAALNHRNIVEILNFGRTPDGRQYMMMAFLEGESLEQYIARTAPMAPSVALGIMDQVLNGLAEAHKKGVVHRDMKPSNVYLLREHSGDVLVKVLDFGLARQDPVALADLATAKREEGASLLAGTPEYIAPEQAEGKKVGPQADLYALGVVLFEMLSGQLPFEDPNVVKLLEKHLNEAPPKLSGLVNNLPDGLEELVESLLQKDPAARPQSADEVRQTVQRLLKRLSQDATAVRTMMPAPAASKAPTRKVAEPLKLGGPDTPVLSSTAARDTDIIPGRTDKALEKAFPKKSRAPYFVAGAVVVAVALLLVWRGSGPPEVTPTPAPDIVPTRPPVPELPPPTPPPAVEVPVPVAETPPVETAPPVVDEPLTPLPVKAETGKKPKVAVEKVVKTAEQPPGPPDSTTTVVVVTEEAKELQLCKSGFEREHGRLETNVWTLTDEAQRGAAKSELDQLARRAAGAATLQSCKKVQKDVEDWRGKYFP